MCVKHITLQINYSVVLVQKVVDKQALVSAYGIRDKKNKYEHN